MNYFGLKSIRDLPKPKDFKQEENSIGSETDIEESIPNKENEKKDK